MKLKFTQGIRNREFLLQLGKEHLAQHTPIRIDYLAICKPDLGQADEQVQASDIVFAAVRLGNVRLIDNIELRSEA